jgi:hypothetical protein
VIDRLIDRLDSAFAPFSSILAVIGMAWFAAICAQYAGFIRLPDFALFHGFPAIVCSVIYNAVYWGFIYPHVQERRAVRLISKKGEA